jgi:nucleoid-associated protein YgaU
MQPIERYGVAALLFLIVTIGAVVLWDQTESDSGPVDDKVALVVDRTAAKKQAVEKIAPRASKTPIGGAKELGQDGSAKPNREGGQINLGKRNEQAKNELGKGGQQSGGSAPPNNDSWARGTKTDLTIPTKQDQARRADQAKKLLAQTEREMATSRNPGNDPLATGSLVNLDQKKASTKSMAKSASKANKYKVVPGDTLGAIAEVQLGGYRNLGLLLKANPGLSVDSALSIGMDLVIPDIGQDASMASAVEAGLGKLRASGKPSAVKQGRTYVVSEGDSLWDIAENELGAGKRYTEIETMNPGTANNVLSVGMVLSMPSGVATGNVVASLSPSKATGSKAKSEPKSAPTKSRFKPGVVR